MSKWFHSCRRTYGFTSRHSQHMLTLSTQICDLQPQSFPISGSDKAGTYQAILRLLQFLL
jgi:hypothetical protein